MEKCRLSFGSEFLFPSSRVQVSFHGCSRSVYSLSHTAGGRPAPGPDLSPSLPDVGTCDPYLPLAYLIQACQWLGFLVPMEAGELYCLNYETIWIIVTYTDLSALILVLPREGLGAAGRCLGCSPICWSHLESGEGSG